MNIEDLFEDFNGKYSKEDIDWGEMTGKKYGSNSPDK